MDKLLSTINKKGNENTKDEKNMGNVKKEEIGENNISLKDDVEKKKTIDPNLSIKDNENEKKTNQKYK